MVDLTNLEVLVVQGLVCRVQGIPFHQMLDPESWTQKSTLTSETEHPEPRKATLQFPSPIWEFPKT